MNDRPQNSEGLIRVFLLMLLSMPAQPAFAQYRSAAVDAQGQLQITLLSGKIFAAPRVDGQLSFDLPLISPDHHTVGWLVLYPFPVPDNDGKYAHDHPIAGKLVVYRGGRILHAFDTDQEFWDWHFSDNGTRIAYSTGPTHGGAALCFLRDVRTGRVVTRWDVGSGEPPVWAKELRK
jgi:hypothetical protein